MNVTNNEPWPEPAPEDEEPLAFPTEDQIRGELETENDKLRAEAADLKDKLLRTLAEMENLRRRTQREIEDAKSYGMASFARDMLGVADNLRRALDALPADERANADAAFTALLEGVEMTERDMLKTLEKFGVREIKPLGEKFDPNLHQAMFEVPDDLATPGTVVQVMQSGFVIGERMLRPAMVGIAKKP